ncbi:MAG: hypothetical protein ACRD2A_14195, partial [Vicinamibacterales bacterium]
MNDLHLLLDSLPLLSIGGSVGIVSAALALGIRHGIDWDHIAAITDITSTTAALDEEEQVLVKEPGLMITDESHHAIAHEHEAEDAGSAIIGGVSVATARSADAHWHEPVPLHHPHHHRHVPLTDRHDGAVAALLQRQRPALLLGTMYALGHGAVVL